MQVKMPLGLAVFFGLAAFACGLALSPPHGCSDTADRHVTSEPTPDRRDADEAPTRRRKSPMRNLTSEGSHPPYTKPFGSPHIKF